jgi:TonB family protein
MSEKIARSISSFLNNLQPLANCFWLFAGWHHDCIFFLGAFPVEEEVVGIASKVFLGTVILSLAGTLANGQQIEEGKRKTKTKINPVYPELARNMNISGKVKVEVVVAPDGHVKSARPVGGHPLLVQACLEAVKNWRFEATPEETTEVIEFTFNR